MSVHNMSYEAMVCYVMVGCYGHYPALLYSRARFKSSREDFLVDCWGAGLVGGGDFGFAALWLLLQERVRVQVPFEPGLEPFL